MNAHEEEVWQRIVNFFTQVRVEYTWNGLTSREALFVLGVVYGELAKATAERDELLSGIARVADTGRTDEARFWPTLDEDILRACSRLVYEQETGQDWHLAPTDPGLDPAWRAKARAH